MKQPISKVLDLAQLDALVEPFMVQVSRIKGGAHTPIPLPQGEQGEPAGTGWTKDMVREMSNGWLAREWCGGGNYQIAVTDASQPPQTLVWQSYWPLNEYGPERTPGTPRTIVESQVVPITAGQPQHQQVNHMPSFPNGLPTMPPYTYAAPTPQYQAPQYYPQPMYAQSPYGYGQNSAQAQAEAARRENEARVADLEAKLRQSELAAQKRDFDAQLERKEREHATSLQRLEQQISQLAVAQQSRALSPEAESLKEQNRMLQMQIEAAERARESDRRERETREAMERLNQGIQTQIVAMQTQHQQTLQTLQAQAQTRGPDPMIQVLMDQNRNSMEAMKEIARQASQQVEKLQPFMMNPRDMMLMQKEASTGMDQITQKMATAFGSALEMQQKVLESSLQLNQGGSPVVDLVREGVSNVKELAERYVTSTNRAKQIEAQSQADIEKSRAQQAMVQAQAQVAMANANRMPPPAPMPPPRPAQPLQGPNGQNANNFDSWRKNQDAQMTVPQPQPRETVGAGTNGVPTNGANHHHAHAHAHATHATPLPSTNMGRSDLQWFGPAMGEVVQVRQRVAAYMRKMQEALAGKQVQLEEDDASAENVAQGILTAAMMVQAQGLPIPAMTELLAQGHYLEFTRLLIPNAPEPFHEDVVRHMKILTGEIDPQAEAEEKQAQAEETAEAAADDDAADDDAQVDDGTEHDDGSPSDNVRDGSPAPIKQTPTIRVINPNAPRA